MRVDAAFDEAAQRRIAEAVRQAETTTTGEIVPVVIARSEAYPEARYRGGLGLALAVTAAAATFGAHLPLYVFVALQLGAFLLGFGVSGWDPLERLLVGRRTLEEAVRARAHHAFFEHGVQRTQEGTGVLVFASLFEHVVVVLGDHGVNAKVDEAGWRTVTQAFGARMRERRPAEAVCDAVSACGALLAKVLPSAAGVPNPNQLPDHVRVP